MVCKSRWAVVFEVIARCAISARLARRSSASDSSTAKTFSTAAAFSVFWGLSAMAVLLFSEHHSEKHQRPFHVQRLLPFHAK